MKFSSFWRVLIALVIISLASCSASPALSAVSTAVPIVLSQPAQVQPTQAQPAQAQPTAAPAAQSTSTAVPAASATPASTPTTVLSTPAAAIACATPAGLTPALTEGPYFKTGSPEKASLIGNLPGMKLVLTGYVLGTNCQPLAGALLDFWQADSLGKYDNAGYTLRGHQYSAADGSYRLETVVPGLYPGRTEHIHFKVQAKNGPLLTSQLFFPGVTQNKSDGIYSDKLLITVKSASTTEMVASFNFIVAAK